MSNRIIKHKDMEIDIDALQSGTINIIGKNNIVDYVIELIDKTHDLNILDDLIYELTVLRDFYKKEMV